MSESNTVSVDEAQHLCGFGSLYASAIVRKASIAIRHSAKKLETSTSVEFPIFQLHKYAIKEAREKLEDEGFTVTTKPDKGKVKMTISWYVSFEIGYDILL